MDAIVIAGGVPTPEEPLYTYTQGKPKALVDVAGKPMVQWVFDALDQAKKIQRVVVIGLPDGRGLTSAKTVEYIPSQGGILQNIRAGVEKTLQIDPKARHVLTVSSDIPAITGEIVDWLVDTTMQTDHDIYYSVITRQVMEKRFPNSKRTYTRLKNVEVCGGDMNMIRTLTVTGNEELWERIVAARKSALKQAALLGFGTLLLVLLRRLDLEAAVRRVCKKFGITGRAILSPYAEIGMDVDKPHQLDILREDLAQRA